MLYRSKYTTGMLAVVISIFKTMLVDTQDKIINMLTFSETQLELFKMIYNIY